MPFSVQEIYQQHILKEEVILVTPQIAEQLLSTNYTNRPINKELVEKFKETMKTGKWKLHKPGIELTCDGKLLNGQHRLTAIIESGCTVEMWITTTDVRTNRRAK